MQGDFGTPAIWFINHLINAGMSPKIIFAMPVSGWQLKVEFGHVSLLDNNRNRKGRSEFYGRE
jgi:hypothetical protein